MLTLERTTKGDPRVKAWMAQHYSQPKGFVGRQIIYVVLFNGVAYGAVAGGSATKHLPGRRDFFGRDIPLDDMINNTFYHVDKPAEGYPLRNFTSFVIKAWRKQVEIDWCLQYGSGVQGFETLVELPRSGELYRRDGWQDVGTTKGYTCKRAGGKGTDSYTGRRVWNTTELRPKRVFVRCV